MRNIPSARRILLQNIAEGRSMIFGPQSEIVGLLYDMEKEGIIVVHCAPYSAIHNTYTPELTELGKMVMSIRDL